jgi:hypothetical protein
VVSVISGGRRHLAPPDTWKAKGGRFKITKVPEDWSKICVQVSVGNATPQRCVLGVTPCGVSRYIALVRKLEKNSGMSIEGILNSLRTSAGYVGDSHDHMMGLPPAPKPTWPAVPAKAESVDGWEHWLSEDEVRTLTTLSAHAFGKTTGMTTDLFGKEVALGHVITALCAGLHRNASYTPAIVGWLPPLHVVPFDKLWGETLGGDLGESAFLVQEKQASTFIGPGSGSEYCELYADLDGLALGDQAFSLLKAAGSVSALLEGYYIVRVNDDATRWSVAKRMTQIPLERAQLMSEAMNFAFYCSRDRDWKRHKKQRELRRIESLRESDEVTRWDVLSGADNALVERAVDEFASWSDQERTQERAAMIQADKDDALDATEGYG